MIATPRGATAPEPVTQRPGAERAGFGRVETATNAITLQSATDAAIVFNAVCVDLLGATWDSAPGAFLGLVDETLRDVGRTPRPTGGNLGGPVVTGPYSDGDEHHLVYEGLHGWASPRAVVVVTVRGCTVSVWTAGSKERDRAIAAALPAVAALALRVVAERGGPAPAPWLAA